MDIGQGAGLSGASGVRPFLPTLLTGALAREDAGVDFDNTTFDFLESPAFLLVVLLFAVAIYARDRRRQTEPRVEREIGEARASINGARPRTNPLDAALVIVGLTLGGLLFAGSLADGDHPSLPGAVGGVACAALGYLALAALFDRARRRLSSQGAGASGALTLLGVYADGIALGIAGLSILFPPLGFVALAAFLVLLFRTRGERGQKFEGLRVLR